MVPGIGAALKGRRGIEAPAGVGVQTDRESGVGVIRQSTTGMIRKDSDKDRIKSTSLSNLLAPEMSAAGAGEPSNAPPDKRRMTQEVSGVSDASVLDVVRATHAYKAEFEDELAFEAGDIIEVLEKKSEDEGWWRGRIKGLLFLLVQYLFSPLSTHSYPFHSSVHLSLPLVPPELVLRDQFVIVLQELSFIELLRFSIYCFSWHLPHLYYMYCTLYKTVYYNVQ